LTPTQGFAVGFAVSVSAEAGSVLIPWDYFIGDAVIQDIGDGWSFGYEALSSMATIDGNRWPCPDCFPTTPVIDTDPRRAQDPAWLHAPDIDNDGIADPAFNFQIMVPPDRSITSRSAPRRVLSQYMRYFALPSLQPYEARPIRGTLYNTQYIIMPWDGIFETSTQAQNCYFFTSLNYDYDEGVISNAITMVRCWAICGLDFITNDQHLANYSAFGWLHWTPNRTARDTDRNSRSATTRSAT